MSNSKFIDCVKCLENIKTNVECEQFDKAQFFEDYATVLESIKDISTLNE